MAHNTWSPQVAKALSEFYREQLLYGGGIDVFHSGSIFHRGSQHGAGFASIIGKLFKVATPFIKSSAKYLGRQGVGLARDIALDALAGEPLNISAKRNASLALEKMKGDLRRKVARTVSPRPRKVNKKKKKRGKALDNFM